MDDKILRLLALHYLRRTMAQSRTTIDTSELVQDQRKKRSAVKELVKAGYLEGPGGEVNANIYNVTAKAYSETPSHAPNLTEQYLKRDWPDEVNGIPFSDLALPEKKFVWERADLYRLHMWDRSRHTCLEVRRDEGPKLLSGIYDSREFCLVVSDEEMREARSNKLFHKKLEDAKKLNFAWGLQQAGLLTEEESKQIAVSEPSPFGSNMHFSKDPTKWEGELPQLVERLQARIRGDRVLLDTLGKLTREMESYGGWAKFHADYEKGLINELAKEGAVKKPVDSTYIDWKMLKEIFTFLHVEFDIDAAKKVLQTVPHEIGTLTLETAKSYVGEPPTDGPQRLGLIRVDWKNVLDDAVEMDLSIPIILAHIKVGTKQQALPIDGWNRIARALHKGMDTLPCCSLTEEETDAVRS